jgi:hypothetical protein
MGNKGVSFSLQVVQKTKDGEKFGSAVKNANLEFDEVEDFTEDCGF